MNGDDLIDAARDGNFERAERLVNGGMNLNDRDWVSVGACMVMLML